MARPNFPKLDVESGDDAVLHVVEGCVSVEQLAFLLGGVSGRAKKQGFDEFARVLWVVAHQMLAGKPFGEWLPESTPPVRGNEHSHDDDGLEFTHEHA